MRVAHVSYYGQRYGATRAAWRLHEAMLRAGLDSHMVAVDSAAGDARVIGCPPRGLNRLTRFLWRRASKLLKSVHERTYTGYTSFGLAASTVPEALERLAPDIVNLHWIGNDALSLRQIAQLRWPKVWTLHDMWTFCGAAHYDEDRADAVWRAGAHARVRSAGDWLERWTWRRKAAAWQGMDLTFVTPTRWLGECVERSAMFPGRVPRLIPYAMDLERFRPRPRREARQRLGWPEERVILLFGAEGGTRTPRKGWHKLVEALGLLPPAVRERRPLCCVFGQDRPAQDELPVESLWTGRIADDEKMALCYAAADVVVVPSLLDNLALTGTEAQSAGRPVVTFDATGTRDIVAHQVTGYLASGLSAASLAEGIAWVLDAADRGVDLGAAARARAEEAWSPQRIAGQYAELYRSLAR